MTSKNSITVIEELGKLLREESGDLLRASVEKLYNVLMELEAETIVGASKNQHSTERNTYFNGNGHTMLIYRFSSDHRSQAASGAVSTWMGDRLGIPRAVALLYFIICNKY